MSEFFHSSESGEWITPRNNLASSEVKEPRKVDVRKGESKESIMFEVGATAPSPASGGCNVAEHHEQSSPKSDLKEKLPVQRKQNPFH